jgi:hypothetical protein
MVELDLHFHIFPHDVVLYEESTVKNLSLLYCFIEGNETLQYCVEEEKVLLLASGASKTLW